MLRPMESAREIRMDTNDLVVKLEGCPDCNGRGWFCTNPFAEFNRRYVQCPTCADAKRHYDAHGELPADIVAAMAAPTEDQPNGH